MSMRNLTILMLCIAHLATATQSASAGIHWNTYARFLAGGFTNGFDFDFIAGQTGYSNLSIDFTFPRINDRSYDTKAISEAYIADEIYKADTLLNIETDVNGPALDIGGCSINGEARFELAHQTTIQIRHELSGEFIHRDTYTISITNTADDTQMLLIDGPPLSNTTTLTLAAGTYELTEFCEIIGFETSQPQSRSVRSFISVSVVPAPTTLAALTPLGIAATRRKR